jgi:hypothetical protein
MLKSMVGMMRVVRRLIARRLIARKMTRRMSPSRTIGKTMLLIQNRKIGINDGYVLIVEVWVDSTEDVRYMLKMMHLVIFNLRYLLLPVNMILMLTLLGRLLLIKNLNVMNFLRIHVLGQLLVSLLILLLFGG